MFGFRSKFGADLAAAATASCSFVPNRLPGHRNECVVPLLGLPSGCRGRRSCRCLLSWMQRWLLHEWLSWLIEHSLTGSRSQIVFCLSITMLVCTIILSSHGLDFYHLLFQQQKYWCCPPCIWSDWSCQGSGPEPRWRWKELMNPSPHAKADAS